MVVITSYIVKIVFKYIGSVLYIMFQILVNFSSEVEMQLSLLVTLFVLASVMGISYGLSVLPHS